jgi:hypothetical protein
MLTSFRMYRGEDEEWRELKQSVSKSIVNEVRTIEIRTMRRSIPNG